MNLRAASYAFCAGLLFLASTTCAQPAEATGSDTPARTLDTVVVTGVQPGPGLWHLQRDGHDLWLLGAVGPLPRRMHWESGRIERLIARSQALVAPASATISADVGFFSRLALIPAALRARNNPDKKTLAQVLPADLHARWLVLKARYLARDRSVEKRRPMIAASTLFDKALRANDLSGKPVIWPTLRKAAKRAKIEIIEPEFKLKISDPKAALKSFARDAMDETPCFAATIERVENDIAAMKQRANAWATGDVEALKQLPYVDHHGVCQHTLLTSNLAKEQGLDDLEARLHQAWLVAVDEASRRHPSVVTFSSMHLLDGPDGYLAALAARGFRITPPTRPAADVSESMDDPEPARQ